MKRFLLTLAFVLTLSAPALAGNIENPGLNGNIENPGFAQLLVDLLFMFA